MLFRSVGKVWEPLCFFSKKLSPAERKYSTFDRELLAVYRAIRYFRHMLEARTFCVYTDHKPLTFAFRQKAEKCSPRQFRYLDLISQFTTDFRYISGQENTVADARSRVEAVSSPRAISYSALAKAQAEDKELQQLLETNKADITLKQLFIPGTNDLVYCDVSTYNARPYVTRERKSVV